MYLTGLPDENVSMKAMTFHMNTVTRHLEDSLSEGGVYPLRAALSIGAVALMALVVRLF